MAKQLKTIRIANKKIHCQWRLKKRVNVWFLIFATVMANYFSPSVMEDIKEDIKEDIINLSELERYVKGGVTINPATLTSGYDID